MNCNILAKQYGLLSADERFRLILAADTRGDEAEGNRLASASKRISLSMPDHAPFGHAFHELVFLTYIELQDDAACYLECYERGAKQLRACIEAPKSRKRKKISTPSANDESRSDDVLEFPNWHHSFRAAYGLGFFFKAKIVGWKLFCARWNVLPMALWEQLGLPGLDRLKRAFALAHAGAAYPSSAAMLLWINEVRQAVEPEHTEADIISAVGFAEMLDSTFRERVRWWGGS